MGNSILKVIVFYSGIFIINLSSGERVFIFLIRYSSLNSSKHTSFFSKICKMFGDTCSYVELMGSVSSQE